MGTAQVILTSEELDKIGWDVSRYLRQAGAINDPEDKAFWIQLAAKIHRAQIRAGLEDDQEAVLSHPPDWMVRDLTAYAAVKSRPATKPKAGAAAGTVKKAAAKPKAPRKKATASPEPPPGDE